MGLVRTAPGSLGWDGLCAARHPAPLQPDPRGAGRVDGPGPPRRSHGRRAAALRWDAAHLEDRPAGHGHPTRHEGRAGQLRPCGQALRGHRRAVSAPTRQPQRGGRGRRPIHLGPVVALPQCRQSRGGPALPRPLPRRSGRCPRTPHAPAAQRRRSANWPTPSRCWACRRSRSRPPSPSSGRSTTTPPSPSGATATRSHPACPGPSSNSATAWRPRPWRSMPPRAPSSSPTVWHPLGRRPSCAPRSTGPRWSRWCSPASPRPDPCDTKANRPPGPESLAEAARLLGAEGREVTVDLQGYADLVEGTR